MTRTRTNLAMLALTAAVSSATLDAQARRTAPPPENPRPDAERRVDQQVEVDHWGQPVLRIGQDYTLRAGSAIREAVVIYGTATIEGRVDRDVVIVLGKAQVSSTAVIDGSLVIVGGTATVASGAVVREDLIAVGGAFDAPPEFTPGGHQIVIGSSELGQRLEAAVPWITRGLLWGRPLVPDLPWVWRVAAAFFFVYLVVNLVFHHPVGATADTLARKPLTAFLVGLLVLVLMGPVCLLLAVSVVGIAVVPFVVCAIFMAGIIGKVGVARRIGTSIVTREAPETRLQALIAFVIGSAVILLTYAVPILGIVSWTMVGVFGLGAATLAFVSAYRTENPARPRRVVPPVVVTPPVAAYQYAGSPGATGDVPEPVPGVAPHVFTTVTLTDLASMPHAGFTPRLAAFTLDVILVVLAQAMLDVGRPAPTGLFLLLAYHIGFWTWKSTTVGGIICQLRVVRVDGTRLRFADALVRGLSSIFSLACLGLGGLWIIRDPERQAWHDKIAATYVVKVPPHWPI